MNALGVLTIMSLLAPGPGPAAPFSIHDNVDGENSTTTTSAAPPPTAIAAASADVDVTAEISPSAPPQLIRVTELSAEHSEEKLPLTFTPSAELGPIHDDTDHAGRHSILQHGPSPLATTENEPEDTDVDVYSSPVSLTAMAGASALRSRRPLLSPVRTAGLSAYASTPIKFEGESEHTGDDVHSQDVHDPDLHNHDVHGQDAHGQDVHDQDLHSHDVHGQDLHGHDVHNQNLHGHDVHGQDVHDQDLHSHDVHGQDLHGHDVHNQNLHGHDVHGQDLHGHDVHNHNIHGHDVRHHEIRDQDVRGHGFRAHDIRAHEIRDHDVRGQKLHGQDDTVVTALRGHYTLHAEPPFNQHISLIAHQLGHDGGAASSGIPTSGAAADSGTDPDEHHAFPTISSLGDYHVYPTIGAFPYDSAKPTGQHVETVPFAHKPAHKPKELQHKKGWSKHWKTALRMLAGLAPLALLLAALPPNVLIVNPTQTTVPMHMRGRIANTEDESLTDIASCRRVCEQVKAALSTVRIGGRESMPGFGDLLEAARSPTCAESLCAPDPPTASTTTTTTTVTTHTAIPTTHPAPPNEEPEIKNRLVKKYVKAVKRRKNPQQQPAGV